MFDYKYLCFDDVFEKFSILTVDGLMTDDEAFEFLKQYTDADLLQKVKNYVLKLSKGNN